MNRFVVISPDFSSLECIAVDFIVVNRGEGEKKSEKEFSPENDKPFDYLTAFSIPFEYIFWRVLRSLKERTR